MDTDVDIAIIGAGPYGLATAAHLRGAGRDVRVFGEPLQFWRTQTPIGMWLRSPYTGSNIGDPQRRFTLQHYERETGQTLSRPIPVDSFNDYGMWFQRHAVPDVDRNDVRRLTRSSGGRPGFTLETDSATVTARRVVVAAGVGTFAAVPSELEHLDPQLCSHTLTHHDLSHLAQRRIVVVGSGQSALETAALLHELGSEVEVLVRAPIVHWLTESSYKHTTPVLKSILYAKPDVGPAFVSHLVARPRLWTTMPIDRQLRLARRSIRPAGAGWLRPRLDDVPLRMSTTLVDAQEEGQRVKITLSDGTVTVADHVVAGTGYRVDLSKYRFLDPQLVNEVAQVGGYPTLSRSFETSVPGLHVVGAPAARSHGPLMRFVAGSDYAARSVARGVPG